MIISNTIPKNNTQINNKKNVNFKGYLFANKFMGEVESKIALGYGKMIDSKIAEKIITKTANSKLNSNLFTHLMVFGSTLLSGMYMLKTVCNKKLDETKRNTLAINQGIVFGVSTVLAYTLDAVSAKKTTEIQAKFKEYNAGSEHLEKRLKGIKQAKKILVVDMVYRFIAPVAMTPIANYFGNKLAEKKAAEKQLTQQNLSKIA